MALSIAELGITNDELIARVVDKLCESLLVEYEMDENGNETPVSSRFKTSLKEAVKKQANDKINAIAESHVLPQVTNFIEGLILQETNHWGEKTGKPVTFIEYLTARADAYMKEPVNYDGKAKDENSYSWVGKQTRITYLVNKHLHYSIETAMKKAMEAANSSIAQGIQETVKIQLEQLATKIKLSVSSK